MSDKLRQESLMNMIMQCLQGLPDTLTEEELKTKMELARSSLAPFFPVTDEEFAQITRKILERLSVRMDTGVCLEDRKNNYQPWYDSRLAKIDTPFWDRFYLYLTAARQWPKQNVYTLDKDSRAIVSLLGDPENPKPFSRKGLILGDVQAGKTINYTAVCNKAVDAGYRVIIILSGTIESLRKQTQHRFDLEFAGINSYNQFYKRGAKEEKVGVGKYGDCYVAAFTTDKSDFSVQALNGQCMTLGAFKDKAPIFFVIKKNVRILQNLINWLHTPGNAEPGKRIDFPVLVLDDEADNASVNVNDADSDPTAVNKKIRELLTMFNRVSYIAVTATPFANIFINPDSEDAMLDDDLFPRDFIYLLSPPTADQNNLESYSAYIGTSQIFGGDTSADDDSTSNPFRRMIVPMEDLEDVLPKKHRRTFPFSELPESLKEAIVYFCLANVVRDLRGHQNTHRSMLIHISHFKALHEKIDSKVSEFLYYLQNAVQNYALLPYEDAMQSPELEFIKEVWDKYGFETITGQSWPTVLREHLHKSIIPIRTQIVNSSGGSLDYEGNKEHGLRVIAIGGNCLSRGLTLEGLMVSYFRRSTMMYDTLLQMGRWFGYRAGYADLCRIWMSEETREWFEYITDAYEELKTEIVRMRNEGLSPSDFGLKVRKHPGSLIPTARNKMRSTAEITRPISISGRMIETPRLLRNMVKENEEAMRAFIKELNDIGQKDVSISVPYWHQVPSEKVAQFLRSFRVGAWSMMFQSDLIANHIEKNPMQWDVAIMKGGGAEYCFETPNGSLSIQSEKRNIRQSSNSNILQVSGSKMRVSAGTAARTGLTPEQIETVRKLFAEAAPGKKNIPDNWFFKIDRPPLLMLHVLERQDMPGNFLFAVSVGFPDNNKKECIVQYTINLVEWKQMFEEQEDTDDDPEEVE